MKMLPEIEQAALWRCELNLSYHVEVDGGINFETVVECAAAGADTFVSGTTLFKARDLRTAVKKMRRLVHQHDPALADLAI